MDFAGLDWIRAVNILKPWTEKLGLRHQGVLMSVIRGCDNAPKEDPCKSLARCLRFVLLRSFSDKPSSFIENVDDDELSRRMVAVLEQSRRVPDSLHHAPAARH